MELYQLRAFVTVAEEGQFTRAAERLHLTQPAVTGQIKALEDEFELDLFTRTPTGVEPTVAGARLLPLAHAVLEAGEALRNEARSLRGELAGRLTVGTVSDAEFIRVAQLLKRMSEKFPFIDLELQQQVTGTALEHVRDGTLDASFYFGELDNPAVTGVRLAPIAYCVAAPAAWKDRVADAPWAGIAALPWILTPEVSTHNRLASELFRQQGGEPARHLRADQEPVINELIAAGVGVSLMREDQARAAEAAGEVVVWEKARLETSLWFIYPTAHATDPVLRALVDTVQEVWAVDARARKPRKPAPARRPSKAA